MKCLKCSSWTHLVCSRVSIKLDAKFTIFSVTLFSTDQRAWTNPRIFPSRSEYFFFFFLSKSKVSMRLYERRIERDWFHPLKEISRREKKKNCCFIYIIYIMHYIPRKLSSRNQEFSGLGEFFSRDNLQIFSYITNFVWKDAIRGNDA